MWPWLALKIDITASLDSGPLSFSLCTVLNEKGDRGTVWKRIKQAEDFEFSSAGDFAIERKNGRNYVERKIFRPKRKGWHLCESHLYMHTHTQTHRQRDTHAHQDTHSHIQRCRQRNTEALELGQHQLHVSPPQASVEHRHHTWSKDTTAVTMLESVEMNW